MNTLIKALLATILSFSFLTAEAGATLQQDPNWNADWIKNGENTSTPRIGPTEKAQTASPMPSDQIEDLRDIIVLVDPEMAWEIGQATTPNPSGNPPIAIFIGKSDKVRGYCNKYRRVIFIQEGRTNTEMAMTLLHEFTHAENLFGKYGAPRSGSQENDPCNHASVHLEQFYKYCELIHTVGTPESQTMAAINHAEASGDKYMELQEECDWNNFPRNEAGVPIVPPDYNGPAEISCFKPRSNQTTFRKKNEHRTQAISYCSCGRILGCFCTPQSDFHH